MSYEDSPGNKRRRVGAEAGPCWVKLLVADKVIGAIIGKSGSNISEMVESTGAHLRISRGGHYYPGSKDRVILVGGELNQVVECAMLVIEKIIDGINEGNYTTSSQEANARDAKTVELVVPNSSASIIIGKQGDVIKGIQESTNTTLRCGPRNEMYSERLIHIISEEDSNICAAATKIIHLMQTDENLKTHLRTEYDQHDQFDSYGARNGKSRYNSDLLSHECSIEIKIPDEFAGAIIGRAGSTVRAITNSSGAIVSLQKEANADKTRGLKISGELQCVHDAHIQVMEILLDQQYDNQPSYGKGKGRRNYDR